MKCLQILLMTVTVVPLVADDWPQWLGPRRDAVWRETGIVEKFPEGGPPVRWRREIGAGYSGPAVADGRVLVTDRKLAPGASNPKNPFSRKNTSGRERVLCLEERTGKVLWTHAYDCAYTVSYPSGPRATPVIQDGRVYTLGAEGHLRCLDLEDGAVIWRKRLTEAYDVKTPLWGFSAHPLIDGKKLICLVGGEGSTVVAFDTDTGKEIWRALRAEEPGYAPPMIFEAGGTRQLIIWHPESINSLDPETGKVHWLQPFKVGSGMTIATPRHLGGALFVTSFFTGPMMLRLDSTKPVATLVWRGNSENERRTDKLHAVMCTPFLEKDHIYGVGSYGELRCLEMASGKRLWESLEATGADPENRNGNRWANAFIVKNGDRYFLPNERGELVIARLGPGGYEELSRAPLLEPTGMAQGRRVVWSHPAFANRSVYMRNDREIICASLAKK